MGIASAQAVAVSDAARSKDRVEILPRYPALDGLRGMAILAVVVTHGSMLALSDRINHVDRLLNLVVRILGPAGVDLFFVLSGFLITSIMDATRTSERPFLTFYGRRILRIVPLYYVYVLLIPILFSWAGPFAVGTRSDRVWDWAFLTNVVMLHKDPREFGVLFGHFWSLAIEEQFYIVWPLFVFLVPRRFLTRVCVVLIGVSVVMRVAFAFHNTVHYGWLLMPSRLDGLMCGAIISIAVADNPGRVRDMVKAILTPVTLLTVTYVVAMLAGWWRSSADPTATFSPHNTPRFVEIVVLPFVGALFFSCVVALAVTDEASLPKWISKSWLRSTGRYSYGMALLHPPLLILMAVLVKVRKYPIAGFDFPYQVLWISVLVITSRFAGRISWNSFEKKMLRFAPVYRFPSAVRAREP